MIADGERVIEHPTPDEVIWRDDAGVTCGRWNWRQGTRTRLDTFTGCVWFVLESFDTMPISTLDDAPTFVDRRLRTLIPGCSITREARALA